MCGRAGELAGRQETPRGRVNYLAYVKCHTELLIVGVARCLIHKRPVYAAHFNGKTLRAKLKTASKTVYSECFNEIV